MASSVTISPTAGHAPLVTQDGIGQTPGYDALDLRRMSLLGLGEGVVDLTGWAVSQRGAGANMSVDVAASVGPALVKGDAVTRQGLYYVDAHNSTINVDIATSDPSNPRIDRVVLEVKDDTHDSSGSNLARVRVITGTPTSGATLTNLTGAAAVPDSSLLLANVLVDAAASSIVTAKISDQRAIGVDSGIAYRTVLSSVGVLGADVAAGTFILDQRMTQAATPSSSVNSGGTVVGTAFQVLPPAIYVDDADRRVPGKSEKMRVRGVVVCNGTAPGVTFTFGLYPVTSGGGTDTLTYTLGTVVSGSTAVVTTPSGSTPTPAVSAEFDVPTDQLYALGVVTSGQLANNAACLLYGFLQSRAV